MRRLGRGGWLAVGCAVLIVASLAGGVFVAFGRGNLDPPSIGRRAADPTPSPPNGIYREAIVGTPTMINPLLAESRVDRDLAALIFSGLTRTDAQGQIVPDLAREWKVEDDGRRYTFTLREGVTWHDGRPFGARDVLFTIRLMQDAAFPGDPALADFWRGVTVETPDERTVVCTLARPYAPFLAYTGVGILPEGHLAAIKAGDLPNDPFNLRPIGTGPFAFESLDTATVEIALRGYDGYYGGKPRLAGLRFRAYATTPAAIGAVAGGEADGIGYIPPRFLGDAGALAGAAAVYGPSVAGYTALFLNNSAPQFAAREVRQALALAVDRDELVREGLRTWGTPGASPVLPGSWAYAGQPWPHDPARAAQILDAAGWKVGAGGVREKGGQPLAFAILTDDDPLRAGVAAILARQFAAIGVRATPSAKGPGEVAQALATRRYEAALSGWEGLAADPDPYQGWHSSQAESGYNFANWANPEADRALEEGRLTTDVARRKAAYATFQRLFATEVPSLILYYPQYHFAVSTRLTGPNADPLDEPGDRFRAITEWQIAPGR